MKVSQTLCTNILRLLQYIGIRYIAWCSAYYLNKNLNKKVNKVLNKNLNKKLNKNLNKALSINGRMLWCHYTDNDTATDKRVK